MQVFSGKTPYDMGLGGVPPRLHPSEGVG